MNENEKAKFQVERTVHCWLGMIVHARLIKKFFRKP